MMKATVGPNEKVFSGLVLSTCTLQGQLCNHFSPFRDRQYGLDSQVRGV